MNADEALRETAETLLETIKQGERMAALTDRMFELVLKRLDEADQRIADLDDATPSRRAFEELHNRVDAIERMSR